MKATDGSGHSPCDPAGPTATRSAGRAGKERDVALIGAVRVNGDGCGGLKVLPKGCYVIDTRYIIGRTLGLGMGWPRRQKRLGPSGGKRLGGARACGCDGNWSGARHGLGSVRVRGGQYGGVRGDYRIRLLVRRVVEGVWFGRR